jgi:tRNA(fMet)-specific endonuclease VapC
LVSRYKHRDLLLAGEIPGRDEENHEHSGSRHQGAVSSETAELLNGAAKSNKPMEGRKAVLDFIAPFQVIPPDEGILEKYVTIRSELEKAGTVINEADLWISATALAGGITIVTNNTREFTRVLGLTVEDWSKSEDI